MRPCVLKSVCLSLGLVAASASAQNTLELLSRNGQNVGNGASSASSISANGQVVAFGSDASNLVLDDSNNRSDVFLWVGGSLLLISKNALGEQGNHHSGAPIVSGDGRVVIFSSFASNLVPGDNNGQADVFLYESGEPGVRLISRQGLVIGNAASSPGGLSHDGRGVVFNSNASNLVSQDTNGATDVFFLDTSLNQPILVSRTASGSSGNDASRNGTISGNGEVIVFSSRASNLVPGDTNGVEDVFLFERATEQIRRISLRPGGVQVTQPAFVTSSASVSADGRYVVFFSADSGLVPNDGNGRPDIFLYDRQLDQIRLVSARPDGLPGVGFSRAPMISADGRMVVFEGQLQNFVPVRGSYWELYRRDLTTTVINRISQPAPNVPNNADVFGGGLSADGRLIVFDSLATNLTPEVNPLNDVFLARRMPPLGVNLQLLGGGFVACPADVRGAAIRITWSSQGTSARRPCRFGTAVGSTQYAGDRPSNQSSFDVILTDNSLTGPTLPIALVCRDEDSNDLEARINVPLTRRSDCPAPPTVGAPQPWVSVGPGRARTRFSVQLRSSTETQLYAAVASDLTQGSADLRWVGNEVELTYELRVRDSTPDASVLILVSNGHSASTLTVPIEVPPSPILFADGFETGLD